MNPELCETAVWMRMQLDGQRLAVSLSPSYPAYTPTRRQIRQVDDVNPDWYRGFCANHSPSRRQRPRQGAKPDTYIKRAHTLRALDELSSGRCQSLYAQRLLPIVQEEHKKIQRYIAADQIFF